ncbi:hypothetical protein EYF80_047016 [Liparis tanakae]|uniref:Uncharacterized protein n=1 Tax=Liparis tanakae TaxID=230148 RepID=A0A4Z2FPJ9_9TELE|nr:hypothetical protein EYF80_047016 [Liparis tanakae]
MIPELIPGGVSSEVIGGPTLGSSVTVLWPSPVVFPHKQQGLATNTMLRFGKYSVMTTDAISTSDS